MNILLKYSNCSSGSSDEYKMFRGSVSKSLINSCSLEVFIFLIEETITSVLRFGKFVEVSESPNKANICYSVQTMDKRNPLIQYFQWILNELVDIE